jgi:hypothetical protein
MVDFSALVMLNCYAFRHSYHKCLNINVAEGVRFELTRPFGLPVFKTGAINRSATPPSGAFTFANSLLHYFTTPSQNQAAGGG